MLEAPPRNLQRVKPGLGCPLQLAGAPAAAWSP